MFRALDETDTGTVGAKILLECLGGNIDDDCSDDDDDEDDDLDHFEGKENEREVGWGKGRGKGDEMRGGRRENEGKEIKRGRKGQGERKEEEREEGEEDDGEECGADWDVGSIGDFSDMEATEREGKEDVEKRDRTRDLSTKNQRRTRRIDGNNSYDNNLHDVTHKNKGKDIFTIDNGDYNNYRNGCGENVTKKRVDKMHDNRNNKNYYNKETDITKHQNKMKENENEEDSLDKIVYRSLGPYLFLRLFNGLKNILKNAKKSEQYSYGASGGRINSDSIRKLDDISITWGEVRQITSKSFCFLFLCCHTFTFSLSHFFPFYSLPFSLFLFYSSSLSTFYLTLSFSSTLFFSLALLLPSPLLLPLLPLLFLFIFCFSFSLSFSIFFYLFLLSDFCSF